MSVFYVHEPSRGIVTPLSDKFRIRQILDPGKLSETQKTHAKLTSSPDDYPASVQENYVQDNHAQENDDDTHQESQKAAKATKSYTETRDQTSEHSIKEIARSVMSSPVISVNINSSLFDAWKLMQQYEINHLAITDDNNLLAGLLSDKNILPSLMESTTASAETIPLNSFCHRSLLSATPDTDLYDLAQVMLENRLDGIVIIENNTLQGIITYSDIIKVMLKANQLEVFA